MSPAGLLLLAWAEEAAGGRPRFWVVRVNVGKVAGPLLRALRYIVAHQPEEVECLRAMHVVTISWEEAEVLAQLLERCTHWWVHWFMGLHLRGEVGPEAWAGLARAAARGRIPLITTTWEVLTGVSRELLQEVFGKWGWRIDGVRVQDWEGEEQVLDNVE